MISVQNDGERCHRSPRSTHGVDLNELQSRRDFLATVTRPFSTAIQLVSYRFKFSCPDHLLPVLEAASKLSHRDVILFINAGPIA